MTTLRATLAVLGASAVALAGVAAASEAADATTKPPWKVSLAVATSSVTLGQKVRLSGHVSKNAAGLLVMLQERASAGHPWKDQRQARVRAAGTYTTYDVPTNARSRSYRVVMPRTAHRSRGVSPAVRVSVYRWVQLTSMPTVNQSFLVPVSTVALNGTDYPASLEATTYHPHGPTSQSVEFNLDRMCTKFRGTFGISDGSEASSQASVTASADGTPWFSQSFSLGQSAANAVTFDHPPLKVSFDTASLVVGLDGFGAVGTPEVYCTQ
jgi:hypothetical protein